MVRRTFATGIPRSSATRAAWSRAFATEMSGSSPEPDAVTASTGTCTSAPRRLSFRYAFTRSPTNFRKAGFVGPRFDPLL